MAAIELRRTIVALDDWLSSAAGRRPDHPAVEAAAGSLSYAQLDTAAAACARRLAARGVEQDDRVATTLPAGLDFAVLVHALPRLGAALVPLNTRLRAGELRAQREHCGARLVVDEPPEGEQADVALRAQMDPEALHTVLYTSGTTARPRAVELSAANHHASALASRTALALSEEDRWLSPLPLFHVGGLAVLLRSALCASTAVLHDGFEAAAVAAELEGGRVTLASLVPTMLHRLREGGLSAAPMLRALLLGGGPIPGGLLDWARAGALPVALSYGMTETASQIALVAPAEAARGVRSARALEGVELRIAAGGEILVRGPMVARGALAPDGWLHTGDRGRLDHEGRLRVEGRLKDVIVSGGENVLATAVEEALLAHPAVAEAGVAGLPHPEWGELVGAFVVMRGEAADEELIAHCRERLARFAVPKELHRVRELPRNATGKIVRAKLAPLARRDSRPGHGDDGRS